MKSGFQLCESVACVLACLAFQADLRGDVIEFIDGDFGPSWTSAHIIFGNGTGTFGSAENLPVGGNPDAYRRSEHIHGGSVPNDVLSWFFNFDSGRDYSPVAQGTLNSMSVSFDGIIFVSSNGGAAQFGPAVRQNGRVFFFDPMAAGQSNASFGWRQFDFGPLIENDFQSVPGLPAASLDFAAGGPIEFGYWSLVGDFFTASAESGVDNWRLQLDVQPIPEPSSGVLEIVGLSGWCCRRHRRRPPARCHGR